MPIFSSHTLKRLRNLCTEFQFPNYDFTTLANSSKKAIKLIAPDRHRNILSEFRELQQVEKIDYRYLKIFSPISKIYQRKLRHIISCVTISLKI